MMTKTPSGIEIKLKSLDYIERQAAIDALSDCGICIQRIVDLPPAKPEWNNYSVACLLAEIFDDACACNYNGIDEWLPEKCEVIDDCPHTAGVACWEQFLKHRAERRANDENAEFD